MNVTLTFKNLNDDFFEYQTTKGILLEFENNWEAFRASVLALVRRHLGKEVFLKQVATETKKIYPKTLKDFKEDLHSL